MNRRNVLMLTAASALLALPAIAKSEPVELKVMYASPSHKRFHDPLAEAFMKAHPDVRITYLAPAATYPEGHEKILRGSVTGNLPDVWYSGYAFVPELCDRLGKAGKIADLTPLIAAEGEGWSESNYQPATLALGQVDGRQCAMPLTMSTPIVFFNKNLVSKGGGDPANFPKDWDGLIDLARKISETDAGDGLSYAVNEWGDDWLWQNLILNSGGSMMDPARKTVTFGDAAGEKAADLLKRLVSDGKMPLLNEDQAMQQFVAGKLGAVVASTAEIRVMDQAIGGKFKLGTAPYPAGAGLAAGGSAAVILSQDAAKQKLAWEWIKFATGPEGQEIVVKGSGYMPTNKKALESRHLGQFYADNPDWTTSVSQTDIAKPWFGYPGGAGARIWEQQKIIISQIMRDEVSPKEGLEHMVAKTADLVKE